MELAPRAIRDGKKSEDSRQRFIDLLIPEAEFESDPANVFHWMENKKARLIIDLMKLLGYQSKRGRLLGGADSPLPLLSSDTDWPLPCVVIFSQFSAWSLDLAEELDVPAVAFIASPLHYLHLAFHHRELYELGSRGELDRLWEIPGLAVLPIAELPEAHVLQGCWGARLIKHMFRCYHRCAAFIVNDTPVLSGDLEHRLHGYMELQLQHSGSIWQIGPLGLPSKLCLSGAFAGQDYFDRKSVDVQREVSDFLERHDAVVYVAFGSWCVMPQEHLALFCRGLELSELPFIWAYRPFDRNAFTGKFGKFLPGPLTYTARNTEAFDEIDGLPVGFRDRIQASDRGIIVPWINQVAILAQPKIVAFASHCGWNSLLEALSVGSPKSILGVPLGAEQNLNAVIMERRWRIGLQVYNGGSARIAPTPPDPRFVADSLRKLVNDKTYRHEAEKLQQKIREMDNAEKRQALAAWILQQHRRCRRRRIRSAS